MTQYTDRKPLAVVKVVSSLKNIILCLFSTLLLLSSGFAQALTFDISWQGAAGYSMNGYFSYDDSLINTGSIGAVDLDTFYINVMHSSTTIGTWDFMEDGLSGTTFNFNFNTDTDTEQFILGGELFSSSGQYWNMAGTTCNGAGFRSGELYQLVCAGDTWLPGSLISVEEYTLIATRQANVPVPSALILMISGWLGIFFFANQGKVKISHVK